MGLSHWLDRLLGEHDTSVLSREADASKERADVAVGEARDSKAVLLKQIRKDRRQADEVLDVVDDAVKILQGLDGDDGKT